MGLLPEPRRWCVFPLHRLGVICQLLTILSSTLNTVSIKLLPTPSQQLTTLNASCQSFVYDTMFQSIKEQLAHFPSLPVRTPALCFQFLCG
jgi:hypothetical protein